MALPVALLGALSGFARGRNKVIDHEREKQAELNEKMETAYTEGVRVKQKEYDKRAGMWAHIQALAQSGDYETAARVYFNSADPDIAKIVEKKSDRDGKVGLYDPEKSKQYIDEGLKEFNSLSRPTLDPEEIKNIYARKAVDNLTFERGIRGMLGIEETDQYVQTPFKGLREFHQTEWAKKNDPRYRDISAEDKSGKGDNGGWIKTRTKTLSDGTKVEREVTYKSKTDYTVVAESDWRVSELGATPRDLNSDQKSQMMSVVDNSIVQLGSVDKEASKALREIIFEAGGGEGKTRKKGSSYGLFNTMVLYNMRDRGATVGVATQKAFSDFVDMYKSNVFSSGEKPMLGDYIPLPYDPKKVVTKKDFTDWYGMKIAKKYQGVELTPEIEKRAEEEIFLYEWISQSLPEG